MVVGTTADGTSSFYLPFSYPYTDDAPQSSEDGSGLHSPTFIESDPMDARRHGFRPPPPDLDIRTVEGLMANRFPVNHPDANGGLPPYVPLQYSPHAQGDLQYSNYMNHSQHTFETARRYIPREEDQMLPTSTPVFPQGSRHPGSKALEMPRPLTIPSLLPSNPPSLPSSNRMLGRIDTDTVHATEFHSGMHQEMMSPISAGTSAISARPPILEPSGSSAIESARRQPSLVVIACRQCRARKIRCDSTRPSCNNCIRRQNECQYDAVPKRRGPDKRPGTRQRSCKKRPADGSMPVKKKQKKNNGDASVPPSAISSPPVTVKSEDSNRDSDERPSGGVLPIGADGHHYPTGVSLAHSSIRTGISDHQAAAGLGGSHTKGNLGLRLDMNFMERPQSAYGSGQLSSSNSHSRTHSTQSSQSHHHLSSGSASPMTTISVHHTFSALSPHADLRFHPKSAFRDDPFSKYEQSSAGSLSDSELTGRSFARQLNINAISPATHAYLPSPSSDINSNKLWWDTLLLEYSSSPEQSEGAIINDLTSLYALIELFSLIDMPDIVAIFSFNSSIHWLSFLNEQYFFRRLSDPSERERIQPALVLSALALATLLQSSEIELGEVGRQRALRLRDIAQIHLEVSWNASSVDPSLAQAALLLAVFESSAHPQHSSERVCSSLILLDQIIRTLALTAIDLADPDACVFSPDSVPSVPRPASYDITLEDRCYCAPPIHSPQLDLGRGGRLSPTWSTSISWDPALTIEEIEREQTRRLCWAALSLSADHAVQSTALHKEPLDLFISRPENYALLFPGEKRPSSADDGQGGPRWSPKQSIWALYCRSMLLWNSCLHLRKLASDSDKAEFSVNAWLEAADIEDALDAHHCSSESHLMYMTREHIFNTRIAVSYEFRRLQNVDTGTMPKFNRSQAEEWKTDIFPRSKVYYQTQTANRFKSVLYDGRDPVARILARRPFYVWWFMTQLAISMSLWVYDNTLIEALDLAKSFLVPLDMLSALWPCYVQREQYDALWMELDDHCRKAGISPPPRPSYALPRSLSFKV
nr:Zn 2Cys6 transcription factor [Sanghuangporus sanghuang]